MPRPDTDWVLAGLIHERIDLTVFFGGLAVSGTVVPDEVFLQAIGLNVSAEDISRQRDEANKKISTLFAEIHREDLSTEERDALLSRADDLNRKFITMVDVTILGAGPTPIKAPAWCGRLSQISGWVPGLLDEPQ